MDRRIVVMGLVVVLALTCVLPLASEDSDAAVTERQVNNLYMAKVTVEPMKYSLSSAYFVLFEGTDNYAAMERYIEDPYHNDLAGDDRELIESKVGSTMYIYSYTSYINYGNYNGTYYYPDTERVVDGVPTTFFVKEGNEFTFTLLASDIVGSYSDDVFISYRSGSDRLDENVDVTFTPKTNTIVNVYCNAIYCDITYEAEGFSTPNGSSTLFAVVCIFVSAVILAIMVIAGLRPKWGE